MRKHWMLGIVGALAFALLSSTAFAGTIIDKGSLGTYERHGRFVKRIMTPASASDSVAQTVPVRGAKVNIDKGTLGKYERHGRFVRRQMDVPARNAARGNVLEKKPGIRHEHGIGDREHKNVRD